MGRAAAWGRCERALCRRKGPGERGRAGVARTSSSCSRLARPWSSVADYSFLLSAPQVQSHLLIFLPLSAASVPSSSTPRPPPHPTDQFSYLQQTTGLLVRLATSLPPLAAVDILWARLAREWVRWAETVARWVNAEGGMVGAGVADGWVRELDLLAADSGSASATPGGSAPKATNSSVGGGGSAAKIRAEIGLVRDKWVRDCGWLVGRRLQAQPVDVGMDEEEL